MLRKLWIVFYLNKKICKCVHCKLFYVLTLKSVPCFILYYPFKMTSPSGLTEIITVDLLNEREQKTEDYAKWKGPKDGTVEKKA